MMHFALRCSLVPAITWSTIGLAHGIEAFRADASRPGPKTEKGRLTPFMTDRVHRQLRWADVSEAATASPHAARRSPVQEGRRHHLPFAPRPVIAAAAVTRPAHVEM
jgi:hypothetical protein